MISVHWNYMSLTTVDVHPCVACGLLPQECWLPLVMLNIGFARSVSTGRRASRLYATCVPMRHRCIQPSDWTQIPTAVLLVKQFAAVGLSCSATGNYDSTAQYSDVQARGLQERPRCHENFQSTFPYMRIEESSTFVVLCRSIMILITQEPDRL